MLFQNHERATVSPVKRCSVLSLVIDVITDALPITKILVKPLFFFFCTGNARQLLKSGTFSKFVITYLPQHFSELIVLKVVFQN